MNTDSKKPIILREGDGVEFEPGIFVHWLSGQPIPYIHQVYRKGMSLIIVGLAIGFVSGLIWSLWSTQVAICLFVVAFIFMGWGGKHEADRVDVYERVLQQMPVEALNQALSDKRTPAATRVCISRHLSRRSGFTPPVAADTQPD